MLQNSEKKIMLCDIHCMKNNATIDVIQLTEKDFEVRRLHKRCWILRKIKKYIIFMKIYKIYYLQNLSRYSFSFKCQIALSFFFSKQSIIITTVMSERYTWL